MKYYLKTTTGIVTYHLHDNKYMFQDDILWNSSLDIALLSSSTFASCVISLYEARNVLKNKKRYRSISNLRKIKIKQYIK